MLQYQSDDSFVPTRGAPGETAVTACRSRRAREDYRLFGCYRRTGGRTDRDELVARLLPLAKGLAWRYRDRAEYDDLVQVASLALLKAIDRYDPGRGHAFSTYAVPTIVGAIKHYLRDHCWTVRVPRELHDRALHVHRASQQLTARLGRSPTAAEIADELNSNVELVLEALQTASAQRPDRLDAATDPDDNERGGHVAACEDEGYEIAEASATVAPLLAQLPPREQEILRLRFECDLTQSEIGAQLGISQIHVGRLLRTAIAELQQIAATDDNRPPARP